MTSITYEKYDAMTKGKIASFDYKEKKEKQRTDY